MAGVDEVYHLAALTRSVTRRQIVETNAGGTLRLLRAAGAAGLSGRFLFCSSLAAAGPTRDGRPLRETDPCRPVTWYGESKAIAEGLVARFADGLPWTIVRPPAVYGPRDRDLLAVFRAAQRGILPILGVQKRHYHFVYARDLAAGMLAAARSPQTVGGTYFVAHSEVLTTETFARYVAEAVGRRARALRLPESLLGLAAGIGDLGAQLIGEAPLLNGQRMLELGGRAYLASAAALERDTGFRATTAAAEGTRETAVWYRDHGWLRGVRSREAGESTALTGA